MANGYLTRLFRISTIAFILVFVFKAKSQKLPERSIDVSACYSDPNGIRLNCTSREMIALDNVYAGAKLISTSCMSAADQVNISNPQCCVRDGDNDCIKHFVNENADLTYTYHSNCTGREACGPIGVQWMPVSDQCVNRTLYRGFTGYLDMNYYCIRNATVGVLPDVSLTSGSNGALYLQGHSYISNRTQTTLVNCSVDLTGGNGISIWAIHVDFEEVGGVCQQSITISDLSGHTKVIACDDNNNYNITEIYKTSSNYVTLIISSLQENAQFWIGFVASSGGSLSLSCSVVPKSVDTTTDTAVVTTVDTTADTTADTTVVTTADTTVDTTADTTADTTVVTPTADKSEQEVDTGGESTTIIAAVVSLVLLLILIILLALFLRWKYKKKNAKVEPDKAHDDTPDVDTHSNNDLDVLRSMTFETSTAPWATAVSMQRPNDLPPIESPQTNDGVDQDGHKKKKRKKRKKHKKTKTDEEKALAMDEKGESNG